MTCQSGIIFHDTIVDTITGPQVEVRAQCNGTRHLDCGFDVPFLDRRGDPHIVHDWWVTSEDFKDYELHHHVYSTHKDTP